MATFVGEFPQAGENEALQEGVGCPSEDAQGVGGKTWDLCAKAYEGEKQGAVAGQVGQGKDCVREEAVEWDGCVYVFHRVFWWCESWPRRI